MEVVRTGKGEPNCGGEEGGEGAEREGKGGGGGRREGGKREGKGVEREGGNRRRRKGMRKRREEGYSNCKIWKYKYTMLILVVQLTVDRWTVECGPTATLAGFLSSYGEDTRHTMRLTHHTPPRVCTWAFSCPPPPHTCLDLWTILHHNRKWCNERQQTVM